MPIPKRKNEDFFKKWSPEMAYVLGFFAADGCMLKNKREAHFIEFQITDKDILLKIRKLLGSNHKISERNMKINWKTAYRFQIGSKIVYSDLLKLGLTPRKSKTIELPNVPDKYFRHFVRGYFDGDGNVHVQKRRDRKSNHLIIQTHFTCGSQIFLIQLQEKLGVLALAKGGNIGYYSGAHRLRFSIKDSMKLYAFMYHDVKDLFLARKKNIFDKFITHLEL
jgi:intein-encoded DNA endonuclease-like protein